MKSNILILTLTMLFPSALVLAHGGHDHDEPTTARPNNPNGMLKSLDHVNIEVVPKGQSFLVYIYDKSDAKEIKTPLSVEEFKVSAKIELPRKKSGGDLPLVLKDKHLEGTYDAKNLHRYTLILTLTEPKIGEPSTVRFTLEPRKQ